MVVESVGLISILTYLIVIISKSFMYCFSTKGRSWAIDSCTCDSVIAQLSKLGAEMPKIGDEMLHSSISWPRIRSL